MELLSIEDISKLSLDNLVTHYLMVSYLQEYCERTYMEDQAFSACCRLIDLHLGEVRHQKRALLDPLFLKAGMTAYLKKNDYPKTLQVVAELLADQAELHILKKTLHGTTQKSTKDFLEV